MQDDNERGTAVPSFHDGDLIGLAMEGDEATLGLKQVDGTKFRLRLQQVEALRADNFLRSNIIFSITVVSADKPLPTSMKAQLDWLYPPPHKSAATIQHQNHDASLAEIVARIESGDATLIVVDASYGCSLVAICRQVTLVQEKT